MYVKISLLSVFIVLTTFQNFVQCVKSDDEVLANQNSTYASKLLDSFNSCVSRESNEIDFGSCLKQKIRTMLEKAIRDKLDYVFTPEERSVLAEYKPTFRKVVRHIMTNDAENAPWLETKLFDQLKSLLDESNGGNESEARRKRNKGMGQFLMFSIISGITIMVPILLKTIFAMAVKALVAGKLALLLTAMSYFHKSSSGDHHPHDTHEANIRRHVMI